MPDIFGVEVERRTITIFYHIKLSYLLLLINLNIVVYLFNVVTQIHGNQSSHFYYCEWTL